MSAGVDQDTTVGEPGWVHDLGSVHHVLHSLAVVHGSVDQLTKCLQPSQNSPDREGDDASPTWLVRRVDLHLVWREMVIIRIRSLQVTCGKLYLQCSSMSMYGLFSHPSLLFITISTVSRNPLNLKHDTVCQLRLPDWNSHRISFHLLSCLPLLLFPVDGVKMTVDVGCGPGKNSLRISGNGGVQNIAVAVNWLRRYLEIERFMVEPQEKLVQEGLWSQLAIRCFLV